MRKRTLSGFLALCMVLSLLSTAVLAEESGGDSIGSEQLTGLSESDEVQSVPAAPYVAERRDFGTSTSGVVSSFNPVTPGGDTIVYIPSVDYQNGNPIVELNNNLFSLNPSYSVNIEEVVLPPTLTKIGDHAFQGMPKLKKIVLPESVTSIGSEAFADCPNLKEIVIPGTLTSWKTDVFKNSGLETVTFSGQPQHLPAGIFRGCYSLTGITIPGSVTRINNQAFLDCIALRTVVIEAGEGDCIIDVGAFEGCTALEKIVLPPNADLWSSWDGSPFQFDFPLLRTAGPAGDNYNIEMGWTEKIPDTMFSNAASLKTVVIPDGITTIEHDAFTKCTGLTSLTLPEGLTTIGQHAFSWCGSLNQVVLPESLTSIDQYAFKNCTSLSSIILPDGITSLGESVFSDSGLTCAKVLCDISDVRELFLRCAKMKWVALPNSLTKISFGCFYGCDALTDVYFSGSEEEWNAIYIESNNEPIENATIHFNSTGPDMPDKPDDEGKISVTVDAPQSVTGNGFTTFTVSATVENTGAQNMDNLTLLLDLQSSGLLTPEIDSPDRQVIERIETLSSGDARTFTWTVTAVLGKKMTINYDILLYRDYEKPEKETLYKETLALIDETTDSDGDGLPDAWELYGVDFDHDGMVDLPIHRWGADPTVRDVFVEIDWMAGNDAYGKRVNYAPAMKQLQMVYEVFKDHDINLHLDAGINSVNFNGPTGSNILPYSAEVVIGNDDNINPFPNWIPYVEPHFSAERRGVFRHCMFVNQFAYTQGETQLETGIAHGIPHQYFLVAMGSINPNILSQDYNVAVAGTFMHELGHVLGLHHGGQDDLKYKPNYLSVMNYAFQTQGIVYNYTLSNQRRELNYSEYELPSLDEQHLDENKGIDPNCILSPEISTVWYYDTGKVYAGGQREYSGKIWTGRVSSPNGIKINWNLNKDQNDTNIFDSDISMDLNQDGKQTILNSYTDWDKLIFKGGSIGNLSGALTGVAATVTDELTLAEMIQSELLLPAGYGNVACVGPFDLVPGAADQSLYLDVQNVRKESQTFRLVVEAGAMNDRLESTVTLEGAVDDIVKARVPVPVKSGLAAGSYSLSYSLWNLDGQKVFSDEISIEVRMPTDAEIEKVLNSTGEGWDKDAFQQTVKALTELKQSQSSGSSSGSGSFSSSDSSSSSGYSIIIPTRVTGGTVKAQPTSADKGRKVTITATPNTGYKLDKLTITDAKGNELVLTDQGSGKYTFTMPESKVNVLVSFIPDSTPAQIQFSDVLFDAYYYYAVQWAVGKGITAGTGTNTFSPNVSCTRAQTVTFLWRAAGSPRPQSTGNPFTDVQPDAYYYDAVLWAVERGITEGTSATTFSPDSTVTRGQTVAFLYRAADSPVMSGSTSFSDVPPNTYYADAVRWAVSKGITAGTSATTFSPDSECSRAQIVTFLYRSQGN